MADPSIQNCTSEAPNSRTYFELMSTAEMIVLIVALVVTLVTVGIYVEELLIMYHHFREWKIRHRAIWLLGIYPVVSVTSLCTICVPRVSTINTVVASVYFSMCMWLFVRLLLDYYKGCKDTMARHLSYTIIRFDTPPACCCCACLPTAAVTKTNIRRLEVLVLQCVVLQPILLYINTVIYMDGNLSLTGGAQAKQQSTFGSFFSSLSSVVALYAYFVLFFLVRKPLRHTSVHAKFYCLQIVLVLMNLQRLIFDILVSTQVIRCTDVLPAVHRANNMHSLALIFEMMLVAIVARIYYKRDMEDSKASSDFMDIITRGQQSDSVGSVDTGRVTRQNEDDVFHNQTADYGALSSTSTTASIRSTATGEHVRKQPQGSEESPYPDVTPLPTSWQTNEPDMALMNPTENTHQNHPEPSALNATDINKLDIKGTTEEQSSV